MPTNNCSVSQPYKCSCPLCFNDATNEVVLHTRRNETDQPGITTPIARLCDFHSHTVNLWDMFFDQETFTQLCEAYREMGMPEPRKRYSHFKIQPIGTSKNSMPNTKPGGGFMLN